MTTHVRSVPQPTIGLIATPFKIIIPRQMDVDDAMLVYTSLKEDDHIKLQDPFFLPAISSVFPGTRYGKEGHNNNLRAVANILDGIDLPEKTMQDAFIELDVPEALEDEAEALDVQDLTTGM